MSDEIDEIIRETSEAVSQSVSKSSETTAAETNAAETNANETNTWFQNTSTNSGVQDTVVNSGVQDTVANSGFEDTLTAFGWLLLWLGVLVGVFFIWKSGDITKKYESIDKWGEHGYSWGLMIFGIFSILQGVFLRFILEGVAVIIRLLRRMK
jgi:hypothetical protein